MNKEQELIIKENINKIAFQVTKINQQISIIQNQLNCSNSRNSSLTNELDEYASYLCTIAQAD